MDHTKTISRTHSTKNAIRIISAAFIGQTPKAQNTHFNAAGNKPPLQNRKSDSRLRAGLNNTEKTLVGLNISAENQLLSKKHVPSLKALKLISKPPATARASNRTEIKPNSPFHKTMKNITHTDKENAISKSSARSKSNGRTGIIRQSNPAFANITQKVRNANSIINRPQTCSGIANNNLKQIINSEKPKISMPESKYIMGKQIGQGAYAAVKEAVNRETNTKVAIKIYEKYRLLDPQRKKCVTREIDILQKLSHQNIVKFYETVDFPKQLHLVFELVKGRSLCTYLRTRENRKLEENEAKNIFTQVVSGIEYCHSLGLLHRDIKLDNILMDMQHTIKIIDFGFATYDIPGTLLKSFCGTPSYMAPEIVQKKPYNGKPADVWALGILLYALLSGKFPFKGASDKELYKKIAKGIYQMPSGISQQAKNLIEKILKVDPAKRPSCSEILRDPFLLGSKDGMASRPYTVNRITLK